MCLEITYSAIAKYPEIFFWCIKTGQNEKSYNFKEISIPEIHVQLFENFQNLIALQAFHFRYSCWLIDTTSEYLNV